MIHKHACRHVCAHLWAIAMNFAPAPAFANGTFRKGRQRRAGDQKSVKNHSVILNCVYKEKEHTREGKAVFT